MNEHVWDLLYLLAGVALFIYSMLKKKPKEENAVTSELDDAPPLAQVFQDPLKTFFSNSYETQYLETIEPEAKKNVYEPLETIDSSEKIIDEEQGYNFTVESEKSIDDYKNRRISKVDSSAFQVHDDELIDDEEFDGRKAIIYSEIIKPRYF